MASRSRTTFQKRQKELARQEKQRDKVARRMQRKLEKQPFASDIEFAETPETDADEEAGVESGQHSSGVA